MVTAKVCNRIICDVNNDARISYVCNELRQISTVCKDCMCVHVVYVYTKYYIMYLGLQRSQYYATVIVRVKTVVSMSLIIRFFQPCGIATFNFVLISKILFSLLEFLTLIPGLPGFSVNYICYVAYMFAYLCLSYRRV